ncbi:MAG: HAMP domain-containing protein [Betaproteobacteria bacterium]|nr:HAMP domain-containing protein [Betaproteobacteria bacterium]
MRRALPDTLLARTFLLIAALLLVAVVAWFEIIRSSQREPLANELAEQTISVVNLTRAAIVNADPLRRRGLLVELNEREGIRIYTANPNEKLELLPREPLIDLVAVRVKRALGERTRLAFARDGVESFWVSFFIDEDEFWVALPRERFESDPTWQWFGWGALALLLALTGAGVIASLIDRPVRALTEAAARLGRGETPEPLPESGPRELRTLASAFNQMASDLAQLERDRAMVLAGISHDVRTPLARLRLSLEMSGTDEATADGMAADIEEIDAVIGQFLDFARGTQEHKQLTDLESLLDEIESRYARIGEVLRRTRGGVAPLTLAPMAVRRAITNLIDNARRHAGGAIEIETIAATGTAVVEVRDRGPGIPAGEVERLKQPFARLDRARTGSGGSGLGLAIVERIARAHGGRVELLPRENGGLVARLVIARA